jgi:DnaK suppressor protein
MATGKNRKAKGGEFEGFENALKAKRDELRKSIEQLRADMLAEHDPDDEAAAAVWSVERELAMTNLDRATRTLAEVEAALRSIESGNYGTCARCEERISDARLKALPWTRLCLECAGGGIRQTPTPASQPMHPNVLASALQASGRGRVRAK